jgi:uncharacterized FlaG/YvyC family protein
LSGSFFKKGNQIMTTHNRDFSNHQTWNYFTWINNDKNVKDELIKQARKSNDSVTNLADALEEYMEDSKPELDGIYADLLESAIELINYREIAGYLLQ